MSCALSLSLENKFDFLPTIALQRDKEGLDLHLDPGRRLEYGVNVRTQKAKEARTLELYYNANIHGKFRIRKVTCGARYLYNTAHHDRFEAAIHVYKRTNDKDYTTTI